MEGLLAFTLRTSFFKNSKSVKSDLTEEENFSISSALYWSQNINAVDFNISVQLLQSFFE